ncbi:hypothetical protein DLM78_20915 [Leptospira stimsonii]|uniref:Uncharacterized protein n=1 Tax=Leptospira stimsonii TaxID=2202203 RepID=A0A8B3CN00_9LEPT|nr:hypothetical protein DLM78_20915 [Leptospira stimsonii]
MSLKPRRESSKKGNGIEELLQNPSKRAVSHVPADSSLRDFVRVPTTFLSKKKRRLTIRNPNSSEDLRKSSHFSKLEKTFRSCL